MSPYDLFEARSDLAERLLQLLVRDGLSAVLSTDNASHDEIDLFVRAAAILWDRGTRAEYDAMAKEWERIGRTSTDFAGGMLLPSRTELRDQVGFWAKADELLLEATHDAFDPVLAAVRSGCAHAVAAALAAYDPGSVTSSSMETRFASCGT
jgi:hypothetical protein